MAVLMRHLFEAPFDATNHLSTVCVIAAAGSHTMLLCGSVSLSVQKSGRRAVLIACSVSVPKLPVALPPLALGT